MTSKRKQLDELLRIQAEMEEVIADADGKLVQLRAEADEPFEALDLNYYLFNIGYTINCDTPGIMVAAITDALASIDFDDDDGDGDGDEDADADAPLYPAPSEEGSGAAPSG